MHRLCARELYTVVYRMLWKPENSALLRYRETPTSHTFSGTISARLRAARISNMNNTKWIFRARQFPGFVIKLRYRTFRVRIFYSYFIILYDELPYIFFRNACENIKIYIHIYVYMNLISKSLAENSCRIYTRKMYWSIYVFYKVIIELLFFLSL